MQLLRRTFPPAATTGHKYLHCSLRASKSHTQKAKLRMLTFNNCRDMLTGCIRSQHSNNTAMALPARLPATLPARSNSINHVNYQIHLSIHLFIHPFIHLSFCAVFHPHTHLTIDAAVLAPVTHVSMIKYTLLLLLLQEHTLFTSAVSAWARSSCLATARWP